MKKLILLGLCCASLQCGETPPKNKETAPETVEIPSQLLGKDLNDETILLGEISLEQLKYFTREWFSKEYERYKVDKNLLKKISGELPNKKVVLYMGTWCEDSQREVPGMLKILQLAGYPLEEIQIIAVDEPKERPLAWLQKHKVQYIPALIFFENETEINRIVEFPINTLEQDMWSILSGEEYKHAYAE